MVTKDLLKQSAKALSLTLLSALMTVVSIGVQAEDGTPTKTALEIEADEAQQRANIAKAILEEEKAKKDLAELDDLKSDFAPPASGISSKDNAGYYGELLSFVTLEKSAMLFVQSLAPADASRVIVSSDLNMANVAALWGLADRKLKIFEADFPKLFEKSFDAGPDKIGGFVAPALAALGSAAQLAAFFKVKQEFSGRSIAPSSEALKSQVVKHLSKHCNANNECYKPVLPEFVVKIDPALVERLEELEDAKTQAGKRRESNITRAKASLGIDLTKIDKQIAETEEALKIDSSNAGLLKMKQDLEALKPWWDGHESTYKKITSEYDAFIARLEKVPEGETQSALEKLFLYSSVIVDGNTKLLVAKAVSQGADMESSTGAFRRSKISFVGGSAAVFTLTDLDGNVIKTDVIPTVASRSFTTRIESDSAKRVLLDVPDD